MSQMKMTIFSREPREPRKPHKPRWRLAILALAIPALLGGCTQKTDAVTFLRYYLATSVDSDPQGAWISHYNGTQEGSHFLRVRTNNAPRGDRALLIYGAYTEKTYSCKIAELPVLFPKDLLAALPVDRGNYAGPAKSELVDAIIRRYLAGHDLLTPAAQQALAAKKD